MAHAARRWIRWVLVGAFVAILGLGVCLFPQIRMSLLRRYAGREVLGLEGFDRTAFRWLTRGFAFPDVTEPEAIFLLNSPAIQFVPRPDGSTALVWIEVMPMVDIPGQSEARIVLFDQRGRIIRKELFSTGYRVSSRAWSFHDADTHGFPWIEIDESAIWRGPLRLVYALQNDRILLVRIEMNGKPAAGTGVREGSLSVPEVVAPVDNAEDFDHLVRELRSEYPAERLHALCELARRLAVGPHDSRDAYLLAIRGDVEKLIASRDLAESLDELERSSDRWVSDAVRLVRGQLRQCRDLLEFDKVR